VVFNVVNAVWLRPLAVQHADTLVSLFGIDRKSGKYQALSVPELHDYAASGTLTGLAAFARVAAVLDDQGARRRKVVEMVTPNYFEVLGLRPAAGRTFAVPNLIGSGAREVLVSESLAGECCGGASALGRTFRLNGELFTAVGIVPARFQGINLDGPGLPDFWMALADLPALLTPERARPLLEARAAGWLIGLGTVSDPGDLDRVQQALTAIAARSPSAGQDASSKGVAVLPSARTRFWPQYTAMLTRTLWLFGAAALGAVLVACVNVGGLLTELALRRRREMATRFSLGASRWHVIRPLLIEGAVVACAGLLAGGLLSRLLTAYIFTFPRPLGIPLAVHARWDLATASFGIGLGMLSVALFGLGPSLQTSAEKLVPELTGCRGASETACYARLRRVLVACQVAIATAVAIGAGLLAKDAHAAYARSTGYDARHLAFASIELDGARGLNGTSLDAAHYARLMSELTDTSGASTAGFAYDVPLNGVASPALVRLPHESTEQARSVVRSWVSPRFFETVGIRLLAGRDLAWNDGAASPTPVVISASLARAMAQGKPAVDLPLILQVRAKPDTPVRVVGVVSNAAQRSVWEEDTPTIYFPIDQDKLPAVTMFVKSRSQSADGVRLLQTTLPRLLPDATVVDARTFDQQLQAATAREQLRALLFAALGLLTIVIAAVGLYSLLNNSITRRRGEIAIRLAIGATPARVAREVLGGGMATLLAGQSMGLLLAPSVIALAGVRPGTLWQLSEMTAAAVPVFVLLLIGTAAIAIPAMRAARLDPAMALKQ
jgi:putative ABC transport system permease protein